MLDVTGCSSLITGGSRGVSSLTCNSIDDSATAPNSSIVVVSESVSPDRLGYSTYMYIRL